MSFEKKKIIIQAITSIASFVKKKTIHTEHLFILQNYGIQRLQKFFNNSDTEIIFFISFAHCNNISDAIKFIRITRFFSQFTKKKINKYSVHTVHTLIRQIQQRAVLICNHLDKE